ncbi:UDP-N-acetylmuramate--L-alanine ligase [Serinibacter arcticus]|uniref:UDP-N-acetylmuramate--L-alanine ligase n=1 Tax=Serinibacter arcticus TaxID=1655435 RepID=A0A2U1ZSR5_9MICO|nr:UDP-N-acetylmuramate--L-alanine ligase [Serinibacter arcticus]PWD50027.1 UDP-N-acetylmuramate--L-alanine ligase [Serinibacter arcticus]
MSHWHFIAIGGHGMSVLAEIALELGHRVTGSDQVEGEEVVRLRERGAHVDIGHDADQVVGADVVVVSTAIPPTNVEVVRAGELGIEVLHRSEAMTRLTAGRPFYAVAGTHGKTTTSAMLAVALEGAGADPGAAIGGTVTSWSAGSRVGTGPFVAEADESDGSFLRYTPRVAIVTNVEEDHLAHYSGLAEILDAFESFAHRLTADGVLVACSDDAGSLEIARRAHGAGLRVRTYGQRPPVLPDGAILAVEHLQLDDVSLTGTDASATLTLRGSDGEPRLAPFALRVPAPGLHTVLDAAASWAAAIEATGLDGAAAVADALEGFTGAGRRFETVGTADDVRVVDDYAHNPTKVAAALAAGRLAVGDGRVVALFQPALFTRTRDFAEEFAEALDAADAVVVCDVFGSREDPIDGVTSGLITQAEPDSRAERGAMPFQLVPDRLEAARRTAALAGPGDLVMTIGSGDVTLLAPVVLEHLRARAAEQA